MVFGGGIYLAPKPFRPLREMGPYTIIKAQAYAYSDSIDLAIQGVRLAHAYGSMRHVSRVQMMYDR